MSFRETVSDENDVSKEDAEKTYETYDWAKELEQAEVQQSLAYLIQKLPEIQQFVESLDKLKTFGAAVLQDKETIQSFENRFQAYPVNAQTIEAGIQLIGKLPTLLQYIEFFERVTFFIQDVLSDEQSMEQMKHSMKQLPIMKEGKEVFEMAREIKERAQYGQPEQISLFTLMKWLKDPTVQRGLHFVNTALTVINEKRNR